MSEQTKDFLEALAVAGVCAFDRDECTVTLALDTPQQVVAIINALPGKNRVKLISTIGEG